MSVRRPAAESLDVSYEIVLGQMGCGDLIYELREQFRRLAPGERVRLVTRDPGAPIDIPAWCRMTKRTLVAADPPHYVIENGRPPAATTPATTKTQQE